MVPAPRKVHAEGEMKPTGSAAESSRGSTLLRNSTIRTNLEKPPKSTAMNSQQGNEAEFPAATGAEGIDGIDSPSAGQALGASVSSDEQDGAMRLLPGRRHMELAAQVSATEKLMAALRRGGDVLLRGDSAKVGSPNGVFSKEFRRRNLVAGRRLAGHDRNGRAGELHLERTFNGRIRGHAALVKVAWNRSRQCLQRRGISAETC